VSATTTGESRFQPAALISAFHPWAEVAEVVQRRLVDFGNPEKGWEILWVGAGAARAATWWAARLDAPTAAVDPDSRAIAWAQRAARGAGVAAQVTLQQGHADDLPHTEAVFDFVVANVLYDPPVDPVAAIANMARVVRPLRPVVVAVPVWSGTPQDTETESLARIGIRPRFLTAWRQVAREAGLVEITAETVIPGGPWMALGRLGEVARASYAAGIRGARTLLASPARTYRRLAREGALDLAMVRGMRWPEA
jgi:SAM-dependent methyltransferase